MDFQAVSTCTGRRGWEGSRMLTVWNSIKMDIRMRSRGPWCRLGQRWIFCRFEDEGRGWKRTWLLLLHHVQISALALLPLHRPSPISIPSDTKSLLAYAKKMWQRSARSNCVRSQGWRSPYIWCLGPRHHAFSLEPQHDQPPFRGCGSSHAFN